jgi:hypothetical protein
MSAFRNLVIAVAILSGVVIGCDWLRIAWFEAFLVGRTFQSSYAWFNPNALVDWLFYLLIFLPVGAVCGVLLVGRRTYVWAAGVGAGYSLLHLMLDTNVLYSSARVSTYVWVYGQYLFPRWQRVSGPTRSPKCVHAGCGHVVPDDASKRTLRTSREFPGYDVGAAAA